MKLKKLCFSLVCISLLFGNFAFAKQDKSHEHKFQKAKKQKHLPYGLQKKVQNGGELPPGWQKKLKKGEIIDQSILNQGVIINSNIYPKKYMGQDTQVYKIQDKVIRVINATNEILDILK